MGAEAVLALMEATEEIEPCVISLDGNQAVRVPLMGCVLKTQAVARAMKVWKHLLHLVLNPLSVDNEDSFVLYDNVSKPY